MSERTSIPVPTFSSPLADGLSRFLAFKRAGGCRYHDEARALRVLDQFLITAVNPHDPVITLEVVRGYVARKGEESETTRAHRLSLIRQVCRFLALEEARTTVPAPRFLGIHRRTFVARVMSQEEGQRFLVACERLVTRSWSPIRDTVLGTALVLLYVTGLRTGEVLRLTIADVDLAGAVLRVRDTKFGKSRLVPVASDVAARLTRCRTTIERHLGARPPDAPFFPTASGRRYSHTALSTAFHQVLVRADIPRHNAGRTLRLHDLRHGFAVLRLLVWYQQEADLGARLPALATYLGHVGLASSQRYLQLTADMVGEIGRRHERRFGYLITDGGRP
ncbi:MAG: tyrosine-type recombinase/integrase [Actinomycetota bacterium]